MNEKLSFEVIKSAMAGSAGAFRSVTPLEPAGGPGDKVFPPTYEGGRYAVEQRMWEGAPVDCVLLDSVQSQANRMELALLDAVEAGDLDLPLLEVTFRDVPKPLRVTSLEAPHRAADAIFRDSLYREADGTQVDFRHSSRGRILDTADLRNATGLFGLCPTALLFGLWDSTGPRGGLGAKFQRAIVSEMYGIQAVKGTKTSSRIDPLQILLGAGPVYQAQDGGWTLDEASARRDKKGPMKVGKDGKPSEINHGNVTPTLAEGGFTLSRAFQTTVISLPALRRLRFPLGDDGVSQPAVNLAGRTVLACLGLYAASLVREQGADLRSRCHLVATEPPVWQLLEGAGRVRTFDLDATDALAAVRTAVDEARALGLPWEGRIALEPSADLHKLLQRSQDLAAASPAEEA